MPEHLSRAAAEIQDGARSAQVVSLALSRLQPPEQMPVARGKIEVGVELLDRILFIEDEGPHDQLFRRHRSGIDVEHEVSEPILHVLLEIGPGEPAVQLLVRSAGMYFSQRLTFPEREPV